MLCNLNIPEFSLSTPQREIWFDQMLAPKSSHYNIGGHCFINDHVNEDVFLEAVEYVVSTSESLRFRFKIGENRLPFLYVKDRGEVPFEYLDFTSKAEPEVEFEQCIHDVFQQPFDLIEKPLYRFFLIKTSSKKFYFVFVFHHLITDGWSVSIINGRIADAYGLLLNGKKPDSNGGSYVDFINEDLDYRDSERYQKQKSYWAEKLENVPTLPFRQKYANQGGETRLFKIQTIQLSRSLIQSLEEVSKSVGVTVFPALLGVLYTYLHLVCKAEGCLVGMPTLNRTGRFKKTEGLFTGISVGCFNYGDELSFGDLIQKIAHELKQNYRHIRFPMGEISRMVKDDELRQGRLFDLTLSYEKHPHTYSFDKAKSTVRCPSVPKPQRIPLDVHIRDYSEDEDVVVEFKCNPDFFDSVDIELLSEQFIWLLKQVIQLPNTSLNCLSSVSDYEHSLIHSWNKCGFEVPAHLTVVDLFEENVSAYADHPSLVVGNDVLSYDDLNQKSNQLAHYLRSKGAGPEDIIGICLDRNVDLYIAVLAVLKSGAAYLPVDPETPAERVQYMLDDATCKLLLTSECIESCNTDSRIKIFLDSKQIIFELQAYPTTNLEKNNKESNLAYIIYTSGSTGNPKGVMIEHRSLLNAVLSYKQSWSPSPDDRVIQQASIAFDVSVCELFPILCSGGTVVPVNKEVALHPRKFVDFVHQHKITMFGGTPALLHAMQEAGCHFPQIRRVFSGADSLSFFQIKDFLAHTNVINGYGPTETTVGATAYTIQGNDEGLLSIPIGKPLPNYSIYILDESNKPVPLSCPGELCIGGVALARGYLNREDLTAEKFVECDIFGEKRRIYKTGDLARWLPDGNIEFIGRIDHQVKLRGYRIEIGEIESALKKHPMIRDAVVSIYGQSSADSNLIAYLTLEDSSQIIEKKNLQAFLKRFLPYYMVPSVYETLESFKRLSNGKIDRKALPIPVLDCADQNVLPTNETEKLLLDIWSQVLNKSVDSTHLDFFEIGGHSLSATQVIVQIADRFQVDLPFQVFFEKSILSDQAEWVDQNREINITVDQIPICKTTKIEPSLAQLRMLFLTELDENSTLYDMFAVLSMEGSLNDDAFSASLDKLVDTHDSLRYIFPRAGDDRKLEILKPYSALVSSDLSHLKETDQQLELTQICHSERDSLMDLERGPLFRVHQIRLQDHKHVLCLKIHHTICDGWSTALLFQHWNHFYNSFLRGVNPVFEKSEFQYHDFASWQKEWIRSKAFAAQLDYWKEELIGLPDRLDLPTDFPRPKKLGYKGSYFKRTISKEFSSKIKAFSRSNNVTDFMSFLAAFNVLLARYSGQDDFAVGTPVANRNQSQTDNIVGLFVNTLVLRSHYAGDQSFNSLLHETRDTTLRAYSHQDLPLESLVEELNPERNLSHSPLFQVLFVFQNATDEQLSFDGVKTTFLRPEYEIAKFELTLSVLELDGQFVCEWEYNTDLYEQSTIERMSQHFQILFEGLITAPEQAVSSHSILRAEEIEKYQEWNNTDMPLPQGETCLDLFERQVLSSPDQLAIIFENQQLTYRELNHRANQVADKLIELNVGADQLVAVYMERNPEAIAAILGVLKAGAAFVPISTDLPEKRLSFILDDCGARIILSVQPLIERLPSGHYTIINVADENMVGRPVAEDLSHQSLPQNLAYMIYTSGSTGGPKGVMIEHLGLLNMVVGYQTQHRPGIGDRSLQQAALSFDVSIGEIFPSICSGSTIVMASKDVVLDAAEFKHFIQKNRITLFGATPSLLANLDTREGDFPDVRKIFSGGEAVNWNNIHRLLSICPIENGYGPTEASVSATSYTITSKDHAKPLLPIGRPLSNYRVFILNSSDQIQPIGVPGELCIAGVGLARSYLNRDDLTKDKFIEIEFAGQKERIYKTGDLARWIPDGNLEFLGRIDNQVKLRGFRIELGEVEHVILTHDLVRETLIILKNHGTSTHLVAYVTLDMASDEAPESIKKSVLAQLPEYMCPSAIVVLEEFPLTTNGKIDKNALPDPLFEDQADLYQAPQSEYEHRLCDVWSVILGRDIRNVQLNFFDAGGHSLLATQLASRIRERFHVQIPLKVIFECPSIATQALWLNQHQDHSTLLPIGQRRHVEKYQASYAQKRLWFIDQFEETSVSSHICSFIQLEGNVDVCALERTLRDIVDRHETLRSCFIPENDNVIVEVHAPYNPLSVVRACSDTDSLHDHLRVFAEEDFDLSQGSLFQVRLYTLTDQEHVLAIKMHHIISDGWSMDILSREIATCYNAYSREQLPEIDYLKVQYGDFAEAQNLWFSENILDKQVTYWEGQLQGLPDKLELPTDFPYPPQMTTQGAFLSKELCSDLSESIKEYSSAVGVTPFMSMLAGFNVLLAKYSNTQDIVVGTPVAGRTRRETEDIIGFFVNNLVLRTEMDMSQNFAELLQQTRTMTLDAYTYQDVPFDMLVERLNPIRNLSHTPLFQVLFSYQNQIKEEFHLHGLEVKSLAPVQNEIPVKFDLTLEVVEQGEKLVCQWAYRSDLFQPDTIERMAGNFERLLKLLFMNPDSALNSLDLVSSSDLTVFSEWNDTESHFDFTQTVTELFSKQVQRLPLQCALQSHDERLTYRDLDQVTNRLAHHLRSSGVGPGDLIGIIMERSNDYYIAMLAVLKAGGAFLPIDSDTPLNRTEYILRDANVSLLITHLCLADQLSELDVREMVLEEEISRSDTLLETTPEPMHDAGSLAYVIYTSGSTGNPKGVKISHQNLSNIVFATEDVLQITDQDKYLQQSSFAFDFSIINIFGTLCHGATLFTPDKDTLLDPIKLSQCLKAREVTLLAFTPSFLGILNISKSDFPKLRLIICGGEALTLGKHEALLGDVRIVNLYGPTEITVCATAYEVSCDDIGRKIPIGKPLPNYQIHILNKNFQIQPLGVPGELCVSGLGVSQGYLNRDDLTKEKFVDIEIEGAPTRIYRSGDLAKWLPDGNIEFLGRIDHQVKFRGFRLELGEIEEVLKGVRFVDEAVVLLQKRGLSELLVACLVLSEPVENVSEELREQLKLKLPQYMVPSLFVILDEFPLTTSGKVDRRALEMFSQQHELSLTNKVAPENETESMLLEIWQHLLGLDNICVQDDFFELGGHSLMVTQLASKIQQEWNKTISVKVLFDCRNIRSQASLIHENEFENILPDLQPREDFSRHEISHQQHRLWYVDQFKEQKIAYHVNIFLRLRGSLNLKALAKAFVTIVERHESLRSQFADEQGQPFVEITAPYDPLFIEEGLFDESDLMGYAKAFADEEMSLSDSPLFQVRLLNLSDSEHALLIKTHHIVFDGWSMGVLNHEFACLYQAYQDGITPSLPSPSLQYGDFVEYQRKWLKTEALADMFNYWQIQLKDLPERMEIPADYPYTSKVGARGEYLNRALNTELSERVKEFSNRHDVTPFMCLLAVFKILLAKYCRSEDIVVGSPVAGRNLAESENTIGFFVNNLILRSKVDSTRTFIDFLGEIRKITLDAYSNQEVPFDLLVKEVNPTRNLASSPLFQVLFNFHNESKKSLSLNGLEVEYLFLESEDAYVKFDLDLEVFEDNGQFICQWAFRSDLFKSDTINRMAGCFEGLLEQLLQNPEDEVNAVEMVPSVDLAQFSTWNQTKCDFNSDVTVTELISDQVERIPHKHALEFNDEFLTYQELDRITNRLALHLRRKGVKKNIPVGIIMERSNDYYVAMLAILKAGGAFLPIDSESPSKRIEFILKDANAPVLITHLRLSKTLPDVDVDVLILENELRDISMLVATKLEAFHDSESLAYIIYTSGSTGEPKGVQILHQSLSNLVFAAESVFQITDADKYLQQASFAFDFSVLNIFSTLCHGATLYTVDQETLLDPDLFHKCLKQRKITVFGSTPSFLATLSISKSDLSHLRLIVCGGEALSVGKHEHLLDSVQIVNLYGPTEITVCATAYEVSCDDLGCKVPIGKPLPNYQIYILDHHFKIQPIGVPGELCISGVGLAAGYLNRDDLTEEKFINVDVSGVNTRIYRSGDLARWRPDGNIEFLGRIDHQVKYRGYRIELGEIEEAIKRSGIVDEAVVLLRENDLNPVLVGYVKGSDCVDRIRDSLEFTLPSYMIPSIIVELDAFPLTLSGKVDLNALRDLNYNQENSSKGFVAPNDETERRVLEVWTRIFEQDHISIKDDFFELGGHSLMVPQLQMLLKERFDCTISIKELFLHPTIEAQAAFLENIVVNSNCSNENVDKVDYSSEILLPLDIIPESKIELDQITNPRNILLTGATGFLGTWLLAELLISSDANIYCLVRGGNNENRLEQKLRECGCWKQSYVKRLIQIDGDLTHEKLGIEDKWYQLLCETIDAIYHNGAWVNHTYPYQALKNANVGSTLELLRLACRGNAKAFHFVSTFSNFFYMELNGAPQRQILDLVEKSHHGYAVSKWISEQHVNQAGSRGLHVSIFRPRRISAHSRLGFYNPNDFINLLLKGCYQLGKTPAMSESIRENLAPVDFVSRAMVQLSMCSETSSGAYNLMNCQSIAWNALFSKLREHFNFVEEMDYKEWRSCLERSPGNAIFPFLSVFSEEAEDVAAKSDQYELEQRLNEKNQKWQKILNIECPLIAEKILETYFESLKKNNFFIIDNPSDVESVIN